MNSKIRGLAARRACRPLEICHPDRSVGGRGFDADLHGDRCDAPQSAARPLLRLTRVAVPARGRSVDDGPCRPLDDLGAAESDRLVPTRPPGPLPAAGGRGDRSRRHAACATATSRSGGATGCRRPVTGPSRLLHGRLSTPRRRPSAADTVACRGVTDAARHGSTSGGPHDRCADDRCADDRCADDRSPDDRSADDRSAHHGRAECRWPVVPELLGVRSVEW